MIVLDASAMVDALVDDPVNPDLLTLIAEQDLHAPALLDFEVASALRGHALAGRLSEQQIEAALADFSALSVVRHPMSNLLAHILALRDNFTVYDAAYVVLAQALRCPLVTSDYKLKDATHVGVEVIVLRPGDPPADG